MNRRTKLTNRMKDEYLRGKRDAYITMTKYLRDAYLLDLNGLKINLPGSRFTGGEYERFV